MNRNNADPIRQPNSAWIVLLLLAATLLSYGRVFQNGFVYDDGQYITNNPDVRAGLSTKSLAWAFTATYASNWHPATWISLQMDEQLYGLPRPWGFHLTNVLLHGANVLLLFVLLRRLTSACWRSAFVAALFAMHPLHVESVAWITERKDVLSAFFGLLALWTYTLYVEWPRPGAYLLLAVWFALSLMAKPMLVTLPFVLLLLDVWPLERWPGIHAPSQSKAVPKSVSGLVMEKAPLLILVAGSCVATLAAQHLGSLERWSVGVRIANALVAYVRYLGMMLWPTRLAVFYPHPGASLPLWQPIAAGALLAILSVLAILQVRKRPYLFVGWFWYVGTLLPVIGLVQVGDQALADRYTYVPSIGIFLILAWGGQEILSEIGASPRTRAAVAGAILVACLILTEVQTGYWHDEVTLWQRALAVTTNNPRAHNNLGAAYFDRQQWGRAEEQFAEAVRLNPRDANAQHNLALLLDRQGKLAEAAEHYSAAVEHDPEDAVAVNDWGLALARLGRGEEAIAAFEAALRLDPQRFKKDNAERATQCLRAGQLEEARQHLEAVVRVFPDDAETAYSLGSILLRLGKIAEAGQHLQKAVILAPSLARAQASLAFALAEQGRTKESQSHYREALQLDPTWPDTLAKNAWTLATHPDARQRNGKLAVLWAKQICQATGDSKPEYLDILAAAYAEVGQFDQAIATAQKALARPSASALGLTIREHLLLYDKRQPFRQSLAPGRP